MLEIDSSNVKALYRRAQAQMGLQVRRIRNGHTTTRACEPYLSTVWPCCNGKENGSGIGSGLGSTGTRLEAKLINYGGYVR